MRNPYFDNAKAILILLVVFGHFIISNGRLGEDAMWMIYSFHMPAFIFIAGYFSKKQRWKDCLKKCLNHFIVPYFIFQSMYNFLYYFWQDRPISFNYEIANYALWFLLAMVFWNISLQIVIRWKWTTFFFVILYFSHRFFLDEPLFLSLGRAMNFLPFFLLGYIVKEYKDLLHDKFQSPFFNKTFGKIIGVIGFIALFALYSNEILRIPLHWFFGYLSDFENLVIQHGALHLAIYQVYVACISLFIIAFFFLLVPTKEYRWTRIGSVTMTIYLLHPAVRHWMVKENLYYPHDTYGYLFSTFVVSIVIVYIFSRPLFVNFVDFISDLLKPSERKKKDSL